MAGFDIETPNFAQAALGGYQAGQAIGQQRRKQAALDLYRTDPEHGLDALETVDPALAETLRANKDRREKRALLGQIFQPDTASAQTPTAPALAGAAGDVLPAAVPTPALPAGGDASALGAPAASMAGAQPPVAAPQPVTLASHGPQINRAALMRLMQVDPETGFAIQKHVDELDTAARKDLADKQDTLTAAFLPLAKLPAGLARETERARIAQSPEIAAHGISPQQVLAVPLDDASLQRSISISLGTKGAIEQADKANTIARQDAQFQETIRNHRVTEQQGNARIGISQGALTLAKQKRAAGGAAGAADLSGVSESDLLRMATGN